MESNAAAQQHLISAPPSRVHRKPVRTSHRETNQSEPGIIGDEGSLSSVPGDSRTLTTSEADIPNHQPKINYHTACYHNVRPSEDEHVPSASSERNTVVRLVQDWWLKELLGLILSVLAFAAIVIILRVFEDHALPDWPFNISLNTFLALFITIATAGIMIAVSEALGQQKWIWFMHIKRPLADFQKYDDASRGGLLSGFTLLWTLKGRNLASIGVLVSILSIAVSPITQQIITYPTRLVPIQTGQLAASVGRSTYWDAYIDPPGYSAFGVFYDVDQPTRLALLSGMWTAPNVTILPVSPVCSTANCTFPVYNSLALCSSVANVTDYLTMKPATMEGVNMTLPNGVWFEAGVESLGVQTQTSTEFFPDSNSWVSYPNPINSTSLAFTNFSGIQASVVLDFFVLYQKDLTAPRAASNDSELYAYRAIEILFYWCVNSYSTNVTAGNVTTEIVASSSNVVSPGDMSLNSPSSIVLGAKNDTTEYKVDSITANVLTFYLLDNLGTGNFSMSPLLAPPQGAQYLYGFSSEGVEALSYALLPTGLAGGKITPATLAGEDATNFEAVQNLTNNLATSITNTMRNPPYSGDPTLGTAYILQSYVKIKWEWLILLAVLEALSMIFLAATMVTTMKEKVAILKSSSLATMCALSEENKNYIVAIRSSGEGLNKALDLKVRLEEDGRDSWKLVREDSSAE
ncbi:hypothetical protein N431DRAFT_548413 [Stipitochalara longipes BDJ]|nr:hypothetical protein N431DRAFT_548413 [Stipitochalara longipes BDJ]